MQSTPNWSDLVVSTEQVEALIGSPESRLFTLNNAPLNQNQVPAQTHCLSWGNPHAPLLLMGGGLVNTAYRFGFLAKRLSNSFHCVAFDWYGRGHSDWLAGESSYTFQTNVDQVKGLLDHFSGSEVYFLGSSLGGLVGMQVFASRQYALQGLVLNDVGPFMPAARRHRRALALNQPRIFSTAEALRQKVGVAEKNSGAIPQAVFDFLALKNTRWDEQAGGRVYRYDLACMAAYAKESMHDVDLWNEWKTIDCEQLLVHGALSDALDELQVQKMQQVAGSKLDLLTIADAGHTPSLCRSDQINAVSHWLLERL